MYMDGVPCKAGLGNRIVLGPFTLRNRPTMDVALVLTLHQTHLWYIVYNLISKFSSCIMYVYILWSTSKII